MGEAAIKEIFQALPYIKKTGIENLWFNYDKGADVLYISFERPQRATDTDILENGIFMHLRNKKIVGLTIINYSKKFKK